MGAMTIVEIVDQHEGFSIITNRITTRKKVKLMWVIGIITFFMSAILDNLTTSIVMVALLRKIIPDNMNAGLWPG
jgi:Na+/H+ antiporter NhaD/arsenite permease-like protein